MGLLESIWSSVRGKQLSLPPLKGHPPAPETEDAPELLPPAAAREVQADGPLRPISGVLVEIVYIDSSGASSARRITCVKVRQEKGHTYLDAICQERNALRCFRVDRIREVIDPQTGEVLQGPAFVRTYRLDDERANFEGWGLPAEQRYELMAGLKLLAFMARCDGEWHPLEGEVISEFVLDWWDNREIEAEPPMEAIFGYARKLNPLPDDFYAALKRVDRSPRLAGLLARAVGDLVEADGALHGEEHRWMVELQQFLAERYAARHQKASAS